MKSHGKYLSTVVFFLVLGSKSPDVLRDRLRAAMRDGTKDDLESIISECVAAGMPELDSAIHQARNLLDDFDNYQSRG